MLYTIEAEKEDLSFRIYAKDSNFGIFNPLNPPYQGDFKTELRKSCHCCFY